MKHIGGRGSNPADNPNHSNYDEQPYEPRGWADEDEIKVEAPLPPRGSRRSRDQRRAASPWRKQLIMLMIDDSGSMKKYEKARFATEAAQELVSRCYIKSPNMAAFDVAIFGYGDFIFGRTEHLLRPVTEIDPDMISYRGTGGGTKIKNAVEYAHGLLNRYEQGYYKLHSEPERVPPPLIFLLSDGYNGDGNPIPAAEALRDMRLSIQTSPIFVTVGIEKGNNDQDVPNVPMLQAMASKTSTGIPLYFDVKDLALLVELISTTSSSMVTTPDEVIELAKIIYPEWKNLTPPDPKRITGPDK